MKTGSLYLRITVLVSTVGMVAGNAVIATAPLFGRTTAEVSDRFPVLVTPAGYVFSIWGLIYLAMLAYSVAQFLEPLKSSALPDRLGWPVVLSNVVNVLWLVAWHAMLLSVSVLIMAVLLVSLIVAYRRVHRDGAVSRLKAWTVRAPFSLYLGWISVATIANVATALYAGGWRGDPLPEAWWAVIMLVVAAALALTGLFRRDDLVFPAVFVWALAGIAVKQQVPLVVWAASGLAGLIAAVAVWRAARPGGLLRR